LRRGFFLVSILSLLMVAPMVQAEGGSSGRLLDSTRASFSPASRHQVAMTSGHRVLWGGTGANDLGPGSILFSVESGRATLVNVQVIMACTDVATGRESDREFDTSDHTPATLHLNHFTLNFTAHSGGRLGHVRLVGTLRSNGTGTARLSLTATGIDTTTGATVERCQAAVQFRLHR